MKPLIVANWKMNPTSLVEAKRNFEIIKQGLKDIRNVEAVVCAPFVFLSFLTPDKNLKLGAQDCFWEEKGAFTGEVSPQQLKDLGCQYVILGHSERRKYLGEEIIAVNKKIKAALKASLKVIFCVGSQSRKPGREIKHQLEKGLQGLEKLVFSKLIITYEPVWAISTSRSGVVATPQDALKGVLYIRQILEKLVGKKIAQRIKIIYGGSVNSENIRGFLKEGKMGGGLPGAASLNPQEFIKIVKNASGT